MPADLHSHGLPAAEVAARALSAHLWRRLKCSVREHQDNENSSTQMIHKGRRGEKKKKKEMHMHTQRKHSCSQREFISNIHENIHRTLQCYLPDFCCLE